MTIFANDTFTDTGGTSSPLRIDLSAHTSDSAHAWTPVSANIFLVNTEADVVGGSAGSSTGNLYYPATIGATPPSADYQVSVDVQVLTTVDFTVAGAGARITAAGGDSGYFASLDPNAGHIILERYDAGVRTVLGTPYAITLGTLPETHTVTVKVSGSAISALYDGVEVIGPVTDATYTAAGLAGMVMRIKSGEFADLLFDNFVADTLSAPATTPGIPSLTLKKDGVALGNLTGVQVQVVAGSALNGASLYYTGTATATAGVMAPIDLSSTAAAISDPVIVKVLTAEGESIAFSTTVADIS